MPKRRKKKFKVAILPFVLICGFAGMTGFAFANFSTKTPLFAYRADLPGFDREEGDESASSKGTIDFGWLGSAEAEDVESENMETENTDNQEDNEDDEKEDKAEVVITHVETPESVKALYLTSCAIGTPSLRNHVFDIVDTTEVNSVVIDIKDYTGTLSFDPDNPKIDDLYENARCGTPYMREIVADLHDKGVYVIGRITVFQDPYYTELYPEAAVKRSSDGAVWVDDKGLNFTDPGAKQVWDHTVEISKSSFEAGFDELNFDYIRYPSDGNMKDISFPHSGDRAKADVLEDFFAYLDKELAKEIPEVVTSADLFGMTTPASDDLNIGQVLERALPYFDYVAPMVYPSHYPAGFEGYADPNTAPYDIVKIAMENGVDKARAIEEDPLKLRSWIQDFDYGGDYDAADVRAQIQATYDAGLTSWMVWDPSNRYTREAFEIE